MTKPFAYLLLVLVTLSAVACGGGPSVKPSPAASAEGMKMLQKGIGWYQKGCYHASLEHFMRAAELFAASDDLAGTAMAMNNLGNVYRLIGDSRSARLFFDESLAIYADLNDPQGAIQALANQSALFIHDQDFDRAEAVIRQAESMAAAAGIVSASLMNNRGVLLTKRKDYAAAEAMLMQALSAAPPHNQRLIATINASLGHLNMETGAYEAAVQWFDKALTADRTSGFQRGMADDLTAIGRVYFLQQQYGPALAYLRRGVKIHAIFGNQEQVDAIKPLLKTASDATGQDTSVTLYFVDKWSTGDLKESPCR